MEKDLIDLNIIRHAFSKYNNASKSLTKEEKITTNLKYLYNEELINCDLDIKGINQCKLFVENNLDNEEIKNSKYIFVSPFYRCIKTLKNMKDLFINKKIIVLPLICESFSSICDILDDKNIKEELKEFNNVNFKYYDEMKEKYGYHFNIFLYEKSNIMNELINIVKDKNTLYVKEFLKVIEKEKIKSLESIENLFKRTTNFKEYIKKFLKDNSLKSNEIIVLSHSIFLSSLNAKKLENGKYDNFTHFNNCELNKIKI